MISRIIIVVVVVCMASLAPSRASGAVAIGGLPYIGVSLAAIESAAPAPTDAVPTETDSETPLKDASVVLLVPTGTVLLGLGSLTLLKRWKK